MYKRNNPNSNTQVSMRTPIKNIHQTCYGKYDERELIKISINTNLTFRDSAALKSKWGCQPLKNHSRDLENKSNVGLPV